LQDPGLLRRQERRLPARVEKHLHVAGGDLRTTRAAQGPQISSSLSARARARHAGARERGETPWLEASAAPARISQPWIASKTACARSELVPVAAAMLCKRAWKIRNFECELFLACMDGVAREEQQDSGGGEQAATAEGWHGTGGGAAVVEPEGPASGGRAGACSVQLVPADVYRALTGERGHRGGRGCGRPRGPGTGWTRWASRPDERCVRWQSRGRRARTCSSRQ